jgi:ABC-type multidrug transport system ATPase subunit
MIICSEVSKLFSPDTGIRDVNLQFEGGRIYGVIGANGAGKTTLLRCLEGLYYPSSGSISHDGIITGDHRAFCQKRKGISFLPNEDFLYPYLSCRENIILTNLLRNNTEQFDDATLQRIDDFEISEYLDKPFGRCSTGMKKKTQIVASLVGEVDTLIWDEPNDGLDILANIKIKELLRDFKKQGKTIIISSHVVEFLEHFIDTCIIIKDGTIRDIREGSTIVSLQEHYLQILYGDRPPVETKPDAKDVP